MPARPLAPEPTGPPTVWGSIRSTPSAVLLVVQLAGVLLYPFLTDLPIGPWEGGGRSLLGLFGISVLLLAVWAVRSTPALTRVAVVIGLPVVGLTVLEGFLPGNLLLIVVSSVLHAVFYFYTAYGLIRYMFNDNWVTRDELWATGAAFTVLAWGFAYVYLVVQAASPGSFTAGVDPGADRTFFEMLFLSFTTLSSTGLSDIAPVQLHARSFVMLEMVAGMLYLAMVLGRIVGLTIARQRG
ncbi:MAG: ion channel [Actinomycetota bacterium]|nr:ion channel [Actinomycetota bacterium]